MRSVPELKRGDHRPPLFRIEMFGEKQES